VVAPLDRHETLRPRERLKKSSDFKRCFRKGKRIKTPGLVIVHCPNGLEYRRMGLSVGRRVGGACVRNKIKRIIRELFRRNKTIFPQGRDYVFIPREDFLKIKWKEHIEHLQDAFSSS